MSVKRIALLALILAFGGTVEVWHRVQSHLDFGPWGVRVLSGQFLGPRFSFEATSQEAAAPTVEVRNAFGSVRTVESQDGAIRVTLRKVVFLPDESRARSLADRIQLLAQREGDTLRIRTNREDVAREETDTGFETHIEVALPRETDLLVRVDHGAVTASRIHSVDIDASFDPIDVEDVAEGVRIKARHAETTVRRAGASVDIEARHGAVLCEDVTGTLSVDSEHGDVRAERVGPVRARLSHAEIEARTVRGELEVRGSHTGVEASEVTGRADIETSFESVSLENVGADVRVVSQHGGVRLASIRGAATVEHKFGDLEMESVEGPVGFSVERGEAKITNARGGVKGRSARGPVRIEGFAGAVDLETEGGEARLVPSGPLSDTVRVVSRRADIELVVPEGSRFSLTALAERGRIETDGIEGLIVESGRSGKKSSARGDVGGGGAEVHLETEGGSIRLESGSSKDD